MKIALCALIVMIDCLTYASQRLHDAVKQNDLGLVKRLLYIGINKEEQDNYGDTPLILASTLGFERIARVLIFSGANIQSVNKYGNTALHQAVFHEHLAVINVLLNARASLETKNIENVTPIDAASSWLSSKIPRFQKKKPEKNQNKEPEENIADSSCSCSMQ